MPTGYTYGVADGSIQTLNELVWQVARGCYALSHMREVPTGPIQLTIPREDASTKLAEARARYESWLEVKDRDGVLLAREDCQEAVREYQEACQLATVRRERYDALLFQVEAWQPPSSDHEDLRKLMIRQLLESISYDCKLPERPDMTRYIPAVWVAHRTQELLQQVEYYEACLQSEERNHAQAVAWLRALIADVGLPPSFEGQLPEE